MVDRSESSVTIWFTEYDRIYDDIRGSRDISERERGQLSRNKILEVESGSVHIEAG